jgi:hypothetical protein
MIGEGGGAVSISSAYILIVQCLINRCSIINHYVLLLLHLHLDDTNDIILNAWQQEVKSKDVT